MFIILFVLHASQIAKYSCVFIAIFLKFLKIWVKYYYDMQVFAFNDVKCTSQNSCKFLCRGRNSRKNLVPRYLWKFRFLFFAYIC